jgi:5-methylcytosine-specific restriction endonuclease McrA
MRNYSLTHVSDVMLLRDLAELIAHDRLTTAEILAHIAEVDARRLYAPAGYSSMHAYCVGELGLSEDAAFKRIQAARAARQFPELFVAVAKGSLHLAGVCLLAPHLKPENAEELIGATSGKRKSEIEDWLARRYSNPRPPQTAGLLELPPGQLAPGQVGDADDQHSADTGDRQLAPGQVDHSGRPEPLLVRARVSRAKLRYAQALLSHAVPSGNVDQIFDRALDALIRQLEKRKIGSTSRPRHSAPSVRVRHIPAEVRRTVWERDGGQCTFVSAAGRRCRERRFLEWDHIEPVACGGKATTQNIRLRCRAHNQYEAEHAFGADFVSRKREKRRMEAMPATEAQDQARDVLAGLRNLGCRPGDARRAAEYAAGLPVTNVEELMLAALRFIGGRVSQSRAVLGG